jgi:hypothetical protein
MKKFTIGCIGARTTAFKTVRFDEVTMQRHGINVESFDLSTFDILEYCFKIKLKHIHSRPFDDFPGGQDELSQKIHLVNRAYPIQENIPEIIRANNINGLATIESPEFLAGTMLYTDGVFEITNNDYHNKYSCYTPINALYDIKKGTNIYLNHDNGKINVFYSVDDGVTFFVYSGKSWIAPADCKVKIRLFQDTYDSSITAVNTFPSILGIKRPTVVERSRYNSRPVVTFIDDDCLDEALDNWEVISDETGVKPTIAVVTSRVGIDVTNRADFWELGTISANNGKTSDSAARIRTKEYISQDIQKITVNSTNYKIAIFAYDENDTYIGNYDGSTWVKYTSNADTKWFTEFRPNGEYKYKLLVSWGTNSLDPSQYPTRYDGAINSVIFSTLNKYPGWDKIKRLWCKGFEFISHTHGYSSGHKTLPDMILDGDDVDEQLDLSVKAFHDNGINPRFLAYPGNKISKTADDGRKVSSDDVIAYVKKYFVGAVTGENQINHAKLKPFQLYRVSFNDSATKVNVTYTGATTATECSAYHTLVHMKSVIDETVATSGWVIFMSHFRNQGGFYFDDEVKSLAIDTIKYAAEQGCEILTLGEAYDKFRNRVTCSNFIVDCDGVKHTS